MNGTREARSHAGWVVAVLFLIVGLVAGAVLASRLGPKFAPLWAEEKP